jgi:hypothetical protein
MLRLPLPATDELQLADWLELHVLASPDRNSSYVDLERTLRREGIIPDDDDESMERQLQDVSVELERRAIAAGRAYPFALTERSVVLKDTVDRYVPYIFCLCLSFFADQVSNRRPYPRRMFEYLSCEAARNFVGGEVIRFGFPRQPQDLPPEFDLAVDELCKRIKEGTQFRKRRTSSSKDDGLDVIAWRDFPDQADGKLLLVGNCASGKDWNVKLTELNPSGFCEKWMFETPVSIRAGLVKAFFVPRRIKLSNWKDTSRDAGVIFDRCRIAYWASAKDELESKQEYLKWIQRALARARR